MRLKLRGLRTRRTLTLFIGGSIAVAVMAVGTTGSSAQITTLDAGCPDGYVCTWPDPYYASSSGKETWGAGSAGYWFGDYGESLKNRFGNRKVLFSLGSNQGQRCVDPGGERATVPYPYYFDTIYIGGEGSRC